MYAGILWHAEGLLPRGGSTENYLRKPLTSSHWKETPMNVVDWLLQTNSGVVELLLRITLNGLMEIN